MVLPPEEQRLRGSGALKPVSCCFSSALSAAAEMNFTPPKTLGRAFEVGVHAVGLFVIAHRVFSYTGRGHSTPCITSAFQKHPTSAI